jgi:hypothetical protein
LTVFSLFFLFLAPPPLLLQGVLANVAQGFGALGMCSAVHVTGLAEDVALREEVGAAGLITTLVVDYEERSVTSCGIDNPDLCMKAIWRQVCVVYPSAHCPSYPRLVVSFTSSATCLSTLFEHEYRR